MTFKSPISAHLQKSPLPRRVLRDGGFFTHALPGGAEAEAVFFVFFQKTPARTS
jgi:hypothetical protein